MFAFDELRKAPIAGAWLPNEVEKWLMFRCKKQQKQRPTASQRPFAIKQPEPGA
jgi:hypothetical protein